MANSHDYLKDCIDCFFIVCRQKDRKPMDDVTCNELLQYLSRCRYNISDIMEEIRILEKNAEDKMLWMSSEGLSIKTMNEYLHGNVFGKQSLDIKKLRGMH
eukprot:TRINITY_DN20601_c0_g1_i1.p2 TRINITY_DN20601_c0_g1~~TRINITY_DN20601_c0_g1_i1.p2  ORF type:complete len:101 (-),score=14.94 TRINITY_DN20601_c0_g1_i1:81-383(-)